MERKKNKKPRKVLRRVVLLSFSINTEYPRKFIDDLDELCKSYVFDDKVNLYSFEYRIESVNRPHRPD